MSIKTNFDLIKSFDVDEMAAFLAVLCHERDMVLLETLNKNGIDASLAELSFEIQVKIHKQHLLEPLDG